jgi:hypothetical protein
MCESAIELLLETFIEATKAIEHIYFQVPVAGRENPQFRERVYCYELYHQMRIRWPNIPHRITGEIDKGGHPWIYGNGLDRSKPDFTIHIPGKMGRNLLVMEVKAPDPDDGQIISDLRKLTAFRKFADYPFAYYLIYGLTTGEGHKFASHCRELAEGDERIDLTRVTLFGHPEAGSPAAQIEWGNAA